MQIISASIPGCYEIRPRLLQDERGLFVKTFHSELFSEAGLITAWKEQYYTVSKPNVIRGLHFQLPPHDHAKLVYCVKGKVVDVVVDIRKGSPTFGEHMKLELSAKNCSALYIPAGLAHGFATYDEESILVYNVTTIYESSSDTGILWSSAGVRWPNENAVTSVRDQNFVALKDFDSPFEFATIDCF